MVVWLIACLAVLVWSYIERNTREWGMALFFLMWLLTFPAGYVFSRLIYAPIFKFLMAHEIYFLNEGGFITYLIDWTLFVVVGYLQWFVFIPWLARRITRWFERPIRTLD